MLVPLSALKEFIETDLSLEAITERLTEIGLEVEEINNPGAGLKDFITAKIKEVKKHPDADKLSVLTVDTGSEYLQIVCGAPNVKEGLVGVLARVGTVIPGSGTKLTKGKIRGVESNGMMCAEDELKIGNDHTGIIELPGDTKIGISFADVFDSDPVLDVNTTANRSDCLGVYGIARDLAAAGGGKLKPLATPKFKTSGKTDMPIEIKTEGCKIFSGRLIEGVKNTESPDWLKKRLAAFNLRPISALVDITNYMTMMYNRPLHVFDADKIAGGLTIHNADKGKMDALDDKTYELNVETVVISDKNAIQSFGGIIGGVPTSVSKETKNVLLESAYFEPSAIAKAGRRMNINSDARYRFERGIDPLGTVPLEAIAAQMIIDLCGGTAKEANVVGDWKDTRKPIKFSPADVKRLSGVTMDEKTCKQILTVLGLKETAEGYMPPSFRHDLSITEDLVEEVLRIYGYDNIEAVTDYKISFAPIITPRQRKTRDVTRALAAAGLYQAVTFSFSNSKVGEYFDSKNVKVANPIASEWDELRPSLLINLLEAVGKNQKRGNPNVAFFEVGPMFFGREAGQQKDQVGIVKAGMKTPRSWQKKQKPVDVFSIKADVMTALAALNAPTSGLQITKDVPSWYHPARAGVCKLGKNPIACFGELHPQILKVFDIKGPVMIAEILIENIPEARLKTKMKALKVSELQNVKRDFSFIRNEGVTAERILQAIKGADKALITDVNIFDVFENSIAVEVVLTPTEKTLTDAEIDGVSKKIIDAAEKIGATLRK